MHEQPTPQTQRTLEVSDRLGPVQPSALLAERTLARWRSRTSNQTPERTGLWMLAQPRLAFIVAVVLVFVNVVLLYTVRESGQTAIAQSSSLSVADVVSDYDLSIESVVPTPETSHEHH